MKGAILPEWVGDVSVVVEWEAVRRERAEPVRCVSLPGYLETRLNFSEKFSRIYIFKRPLCRFQQSHTVFNHQYVLLKSVSGYWWSIEKNMKRFVLQRGKTMKDVLYDVGCSHRTTSICCDIDLVRESRARGTVGDLIRWLSHRSDEEKYNFFSNNCQHFAERVFHQMSFLNSVILNNIQSVLYIESDQLINVKALQDSLGVNFSQGVVALLTELSADSIRIGNLGTALECMLGQHGRATGHLVIDGDRVTVRVLLQNKRATACVLIVESSCRPVDHQTCVNHGVVLGNLFKFIGTVAVITLLGKFWKQRHQ